MKGIKYITLLSAGGLLYGILELIWRGQTHISMFIAGGICLYLINIVSNRFSRLGLIIQAVISSLVISVVEFVIGVTVNIWLHLGVWDYSSLPANILGQVCLPFCLLWFLLSFPAIYLCLAIQKYIFKVPIMKPHLLPMKNPSRKVLEG